MDTFRTSVDSLETLVDDSVWTRLPTYQEPAVFPLIHSASAL